MASGAEFGMIFVLVCLSYLEKSDFQHAIPLEQIDWNDLKSKPDDQVYVFSYEGQSDMEYYFDKNEKEEIDELTVSI